MSHVREEKRLWFQSLVWASLLFVPMSILMVINMLIPKEKTLLHDYFYVLGMAIYLVQSRIVGIYHGNFLAIGGWACLANSLVVWLLFYFALRIRYSRRRRSIPNEVASFPVKEVTLK